MTVNSQGNGNSGGGAGDGSGTGDGGAGNGNGNGTGQGDGGQQQQQQQQGQQIDLKTLSADQLADVFENENLWKHPRFSGLAAQAQELKQLKDQQKADEDKRLQENNEFKTLAENRATELETANKTIKDMQINQALTNVLVPEGVVDLEGALKLVDRSKLGIDDNGNVTGVKEALESLKTDKAYLFNKSGDGNKSLGGPSNNNGGDGNGAPAKFKRSQLRDPKFYQEHRDEILKAQAAGLIENDLE